MGVFKKKTSQVKFGKVCFLCNLNRLKVAFADSKTWVKSKSKLSKECKNSAKCYLKTWITSKLASVCIISFLM